MGIPLIPEGVGALNGGVNSAADSIGIRPHIDLEDDPWPTDGRTVLIDPDFPQTGRHPPRLADVLVLSDATLGIAQFGATEAASHATSVKPVRSGRGCKRHQAHHARAVKRVIVADDSVRARTDP